MEKNRGGREMRDIEQEEENIGRNGRCWRCSCCEISGNRWGTTGEGVRQRAVGVARGGQARYCYSTFDTEMQGVMETDTPPHTFQHN